MTLLTAGITKEVMRDIMPPYSLDADLLARAIGILPPPPPDASESWRRARLTRLVCEISVLVPADAAQAKLAAEIVVFRETADDTLDRANRPGLTVEQVCRVRRAAADLTRTSATLERTLSRRQEMPAAFFGTVLGDQVDIAALDAVWCKSGGTDRPPAATGVAATGVAAGGEAAGGAASGPRPAEPIFAAPESTASEPAAPEPAAPASAAFEPATPETRTAEFAAEITPAGLEPVGSLAAGNTAIERGPVGSEPVGFEPVGSKPVALDPTGLDPAGQLPGTESAPLATPVSDPTACTVAGGPSGAASPMHDGQMAARAA